MSAIDIIILILTIIMVILIIYFSYIKPKRKGINPNCAICASKYKRKRLIKDYRKYSKENI